MDFRINCALGANADGEFEQLEQRLRSANPNNSNDCRQRIRTDQTITGGESEQPEQRLQAANANRSDDDGQPMRTDQTIAGSQCEQIKRLRRI
jgi:hypothetical protein